MSGVWLNGKPGQLPALGDVLRGAGLVCAELANYDYRVRSRYGPNSQPNLQGFPAPGPWGIVVHHTASCLACWSTDFPHLAQTHSAAPVSNLNFGMSAGVPTFGLVAAGAANTNGAGGPWTFSRGVLQGSAEIGNSSIIGIECSINGTGETWPKAMTDALIRGIAALCDAYNLQPSDVLSHHEWAPDRKIDPAGPTQDATLGVSTGSTTPWNMNPFRQRVATAMQAPSPIPSGDDMVLLKGNALVTPAPGTPGASFPYKGNPQGIWMPAVLPAPVGYCMVHVDDGNFSGPMNLAGEVRIVDQIELDKAKKVKADDYRAFLAACSATAPPAPDISQLATKEDIAGVNANIDAIPSGGGGGSSGPLVVEVQTVSGDLVLTGTATPESG